MRKKERTPLFFSEHPTAMWIVDIQEYILAMPHFTFYSIYLLLTLEGPPPLQSIRPSHLLPSGPFINSSESTNNLNSAHITRYYIGKVVNIIHGLISVKLHTSSFPDSPNYTRAPHDLVRYGLRTHSFTVILVNYCKFLKGMQLLVSTTFLVL